MCRDLRLMNLVCEGNNRRLMYLEQRKQVGIEAKMEGLVLWVIERCSHFIQSNEESLKDFLKQG